MQMSDAELVAFRSRCLTASMRGYLVARAGEYMGALEAEAGGVELPSGAEKGSAAHLYALACAAMDVRAGGKKKAPTPKKAEPKAEAKSSPKAAPAPKSAPKVEAKKEEPKKEEEVPASYDSWTFDELYAEAKAREIPNRSSMSKEELIEALEDDDASEEDK